MLIYLALIAHCPLLKARNYDFSCIVNILCAHFLCYECLSNIVQIPYICQGFLIFCEERCGSKTLVHVYYLQVQQEIFFNCNASVMIFFLMFLLNIFLYSKSLCKVLKALIIQVLNMPVII